MKIKFLKKPQKHDYPAAAAYLSLLFDKKAVSSLVAQLKKAPVTLHMAKDILRASSLSPLGMSNYYVKRTTKKVNAGEALSPILLVRDKVHGRVIIADGYHRLCAVYLLNEDITVPAKVV